MPKQWAVVAALLAIGHVPAYSQEGNLKFEVASVKEAPRAPVHNVSLNISHDRVTVDGATLRQLIGLAYTVQRLRIVGGDAWVDSTEYDVAAKAGTPNVARDDVKIMLQQLLKDRFELVVHRETKEVPVFVLTASKQHKLKTAVADEPSSFTPVMTPEHEWLLTYRKRPLTPLVNTLANFLRAPVQDETGLTGLYDFELKWTTVSFESGPGEADSSAADSAAVLIRAVDQQLGLKLVPKKRPLEVLVVDRATKASAN